MLNVPFYPGPWNLWWFKCCWNRVTFRSCCLPEKCRSCFRGLPCLHCKHRREGDAISRSEKEPEVEEDYVHSHRHPWTKPYPALHPHPSHLLCFTSPLLPIFPPHACASCRDLTGQKAEWDFPRNISLSKDKVRLAGRMTICLAVRLRLSRCQSCSTWL